MEKIIKQLKVIFMWITGRIQLKDNINLHLVESAKLRFNGEIKDYLPVVFTRREQILSDDVIENAVDATKRVSERIYDGVATPFLNRL